MTIMNDAQKAQEIGKLIAETCDNPLTAQELSAIAKIVWPESVANHRPFHHSFIDTFCS
jgi:hypothetical protein